MRYLMAVLLILGCVLLPGCDNLTEEQIQEVKDASIVLEAFVKEMEADKTTREQEQAYLRSINQKLKALREAIEANEKEKKNGKKKKDKKDQKT